MIARLFIFLILFSMGCEKPVVKKEVPVDVTVYVVELQTVPLDFRFVSVVESSHPVEIRSRVEGYLQNIAYKEGSFVKKGDLLFEIDPREFEDAVKEAEANLQKEQAILWQAKQAADRLKPLFEQRAASRKDLDDATAQLLAEEAAVNMFQARLDKAKLNLSYASVRSPIDGVTSSALSREGTLISPNANGLLTTVSVIDPVWVVLNVSESYFSTSLEEEKKGTLTLPENNNFDVSIILTDGSEYPHQGKVSFVSPLFDQKTGTLSARAVFPNPDKALKPGQFVNTRVTGAKRLNAVAIPQECVMQGMSGHYVNIVNGHNKIESRPVEVGDWHNDSWVIKSGLSKNDRVVVLGNNKVRDGTLVKVVKSQ